MYRYIKNCFFNTLFQKFFKLNQGNKLEHEKICLRKKFP